MKHKSVILIVDSKEIFEEMEPVLMKELGNGEVIHCENQCDAEKLINSDKHIDFIFADWDIGGAGLIKTVRSSHEHHHTPVVLMSFLDSDEIIAAGMRLGATAHMAKPFLEKGLINKLRQLSKAQERRRMRRLHPDKDYTVRVDCKNAGAIEVELIDFSAGCCLTRAPATLAGKAIVGQQGLMHLVIEEYNIDLEVVLFRIEEDTKSPSPEDTILMTFRISDQNEEQTEMLKELVDEYGGKW